MLSLILFAGFWNTAGLLPAFRLYLPDDLCRIASDDSQGRDIACHHAIGPHDCPVTYPHAGQHRGIDANPYLIFNDYRASIRRTPVVRVGVMVDGDEIHFGSDEHVIADGDAPTVEKCTTLLNPASAAQADIFAEIHIEWRQECDGGVNLLPRDAGEIIAHFIRCMITVFNSYANFIVSKMALINFS